VRGCVGNAVGV